MSTWCDETTTVSGRVDYYLTFAGALVGIFVVGFLAKLLCVVAVEILNVFDAVD
jgi:hypothetical protein